jgi:hypothetical protein
MTVPPRTQTELVDCGGCVLETVTVAHRMLGIGPVCVDGRKTVTGTGGVATATGCAVEER